MQVLHTHWQLPRSPGEEGGLFLWAETATAPQPKRDRRKKAAQTHPFLLGPAAIRQMVEHAITWRGYRVRTQALNLWLPTDRFGPLPSPELIHDWEIDPETAALHPWIVDGLFVETATAFRLLIALLTTPLPRITLGSSSRYWLQATNLVLEILAQQKLRPTMIELRDEGELGYEARWLPMLDGEQDARRVAQLAAAMPAIARADAPTPDETAPPGALLDSFLNHLSDTGARAWGGQQNRQPVADVDPAERWQHALLAKDARISGSTAQLQHLYGSYRAWARTLAIAGDRHVRVALRLQAPPPKGKRDRWQLHYLLQARDDASLLVPAAEVWQSESGVLDALGRRFERPQERLLAGLGYAGRFSSPIRKSLDKRNPTGVFLSSQEAFDFLRECAPHLERSGFGLLTPPWWNKPGTQLGVRLRLDSMGKTQNDPAVSKGHLSMENLVRFRWELSIGGTELTQEEFYALVALKSPLVQIRGQWVQLDAEQIEAAINFWERQKDLSGKCPCMRPCNWDSAAKTSTTGCPSTVWRWTPGSTNGWARCAATIHWRYCRRRTT